MRAHEVRSVHRLSRFVSRPLRMKAARADREVLRRIEAAFAEIGRPPHFTDHTHCAECAEHEQRLQVCAARGIGLEDLADAVWDPFCVALPASFMYFFPSLARLALTRPDAEHGWYGAQLLFHLHETRRANGFHALCTPPQRAAVAALLRHLLETRAALIGDTRDADAFVDCYCFWADAGPRLN